MNRRLLAAAWAALFGTVCSPVGFAAAPTSKAQEVLDQTAAEQKYAFVCFTREDSPDARAMAQVLRQGVAKRQEQAAMCFVSVADPTEQAVVQRFGVARAPMPLTLAIAPNGAITGIFSRKLVDANLTSSFVAPMMANCLKSMQEGKLALVCVQTSLDGTEPPAVKDFQADPHYKDRVAVFSMQASDPAEASFLGKMGVDPAKVQGTSTVFLAPPGVLIGKFDARATKAQMAEALHKAGKCCDDPNCKHAPKAPTQPAPSAARQAAPNSRTPR